MLVSREDTSNIIVVFCYIFSFYLLGPITSSMFVAVPGFLAIILSKKAFRNACEIGRNKYIISIFLFLFGIISLSVLYSCLHLTFDFSYTKTLIGQLVHLICGILVIIFIERDFPVSSQKIEFYIVSAFLLQSTIQLVAMCFPAFAQSLLYFSRADDLQSGYGGGVRGLALSSSTGWSLSLAYGLAFIIYVKRYLLDSLKFTYVVLGILLLAGNFFAGRTGFVGAAAGVLLFLLNTDKSVRYKVGAVLKVILFILIVCIIFAIIFPSVTNILVERIFPFAFEPFYELYYNGRFGTGSTDTLIEMWKIPISEKEILIGSGYFTDPISGGSFRHTDAGVLRNILYWGVIGLLSMFLYELVLVNPIHKYGVHNVSTYRLLLLFYLALMELKAPVLGFNKMAFSIIFLLSYFYYKENHYEVFNSYSYIQRGAIH